MCITLGIDYQVGIFDMGMYCHVYSVSNRACTKKVRLVTYLLTHWDLMIRRIVTVLHLADF